MGREDLIPARSVRVFASLNETSFHVYSGLDLHRVCHLFVQHHTFILRHQKTNVDSFKILAGSKVLFKWSQSLKKQHARSSRSMVRFVANRILNFRIYLYLVLSYLQIALFAETPDHSCFSTRVLPRITVDRLRFLYSEHMDRSLFPDIRVSQFESRIRPREPCLIFDSHGDVERDLMPSTRQLRHHPQRLQIRIIIPSTNRVIVTDSSLMEDVLRYVQGDGTSLRPNRSADER